MNFMSSNLFNEKMKSINNYLIERNEYDYYRQSNRL